MKTKIVKRSICISLCLMLLISLTACGKKASDYEAYVKSLITANYLGITDEYVDMTGSNEEDAEAIYLQNVTRLADNLSLYYGLEIATDPELAPAMVDLAKQIYGKTKFEVNRVYKDNNIYYVELTIYPIDILNQTNDQIVEYVNNFNAAVDSGKYNDYSREEYEYEFASGIIGILASAVNDIQYGEPEVLKVRIITTEDSYYIGNEDVRNIDRCILNTDTEQMMNAPTPTDATEVTEDAGLPAATTTDSESTD